MPSVHVPPSGRNACWGNSWLADVRAMDWAGKEGMQLFGETPIGGVTMRLEVNNQNGQSLAYELQLIRALLQDQAEKDRPQS